MASRSASLIALLAVVLSCAAAASATSYTVGDSSGWTTGFDYTSWASGKSFAVGDQLVFDFTTGRHDVAEVDKSGYDGCSGSNAVSTISTGPATVDLNSTGTKYYICTISTHCSSGGMKLAVTVAASGSPSSPSPTPGGGSGSTPSTPSAPSAPAPSASVRLTVTAGPALLAVAAAALVKLALF